MAAPALSLYYTEKSDDGRAYRNPLTGGTAPSVTTVLKYEAKDSLIQWAADESIRWAVQNWAVLGERSDESAFSVGRYKWRNTRDERAEVGTGVHEYIEALLTDSWDFPILDPEQEAMVEQFQKFLTAYHFKPLHVEQTVWSHEYDYAGTADWIAEVEGPDVPAGVYVGDIKTSKNLWPAHWMQLAALGRAESMLVQAPEGTEGAAKHETKRDGVTWWNELPMLELSGSLILHLRAEKWDVVRGVERQMPVRFDQFLAYRKLWEYDRVLKELEKEETW